MDMEFEPESPPSPPPLEPPKIRRLDESVVNRIAAGEVIQRPVSAVKELVENSLDAHSTSINVVIKDGGLKLIQVSDDGHGIRYEDLPILCERHTTSKLSTYEDLQTIKSMGFRGEALASMTHVAHVTVTTITEGQLHGYRVSYKDGVMEHQPKACAAVKGTQIMVENLFYNMIARKKTLQNTSDDYLKIVDVISRFAIHHTSLSFSCRKHGAGRADVHSSATSSRLDSIRSVYGATVSCNLMKIESSDNNPAGSIFSMDGFISTSNYIAKKTTMVLFINDRLVECTPLKRALEIVYAATLPKASKPFIYMSIKLPPEHVDVNVHPTKREVSLLNQEIIIEKIQAVAESKLRNSNTTRVFAEQICHEVSKKTVEASQRSPVSASKDSNIDSPPAASKSQKVRVNKIVRTDALDPAGRLDSYLQAKPIEGSEKNLSLSAVRSAVRQRRNPRETADLTSIQELIDSVKHKCDSGLLDIARNCTFVGMADDVLALVQHGTHLYLANVVNLSKEMMYQQVLRRFAHFNAIQLSDPAPVKDLIVLALQEEDNITGSDENDDLKQKIAELNSELLKEKAEMLDEYFFISINSEGYLSRLPVILDQYTPDMDRVPDFLLSLGNDIEWENEKNCFQGIAAAIANFYAMHPPMLPNPSGDGIDFYKRKETNNSEGNAVGVSTVTEDVEMEEKDATDNDLLTEAVNAWAQREWSIQHVLFPSMRLFLEPPSSMATNGTFVKVNLCTWNVISVIEMFSDWLLPWRGFTGFSKDADTDSCLLR
ncbi:DNA mismatch repair protein MLH1 [Linum perenne]